MNVLPASGGYPWTVIRVDDRKRYMGGLEAASAGNDIRPFATFLAEQVRQTEKTVELPAKPARALLRMSLRRGKQSPIGCPELRTAEA